MSEATFVRDVLNVCQGIDSRYVRHDESMDAYTLLDGVRVS